MQVAFFSNLTILEVYRFEKTADLSADLDFIHRGEPSDVFIPLGHFFLQRLGYSNRMVAEGPPSFFAPPQPGEKDA